MKIDSRDINLQVTQMSLNKESRNVMSENTAVISEVTSTVVEATTPVAATPVATSAGRPKSPATLLVFGLLETNPELSFSDEVVQAAIASANLDISEAAFNIKKSQFKSKGKVSPTGKKPKKAVVVDEGVEARRANRKKVNKALEKMAALKNMLPFSKALEKLQEQGLKVSAPSYYSKMNALRGDAPKATKKSAIKAAKANKPAKVNKTVSSKSMSNEALLLYVRDNGGVSSILASIQENQNIVNRFNTLVKEFGLSS